MHEIDERAYLGGHKRHPIGCLLCLSLPTESQSPTLSKEFIYSVFYILLAYIQKK